MGLRRMAAVLVSLVAFAGVASAAAPPQRWTGAYNGSANLDDWCTGVAFLPDGGVVASGEYATTGEGDNWVIRRYTAAGAVVWTRTFNGDGNSSDGAEAVAVDGTGNIIVVGQEYVATFPYRWQVRKYDGDGELIWSRTFRGVGTQSDVATAVTVDASGSIYVTGVIYTGAGTSNDFATRKYDRDGNLEWNTGYAGPSSFGDIPAGIAVNGSGIVVVAGREYTNTQQNDWKIIAYDTGGNVVWSRSYNSPANLADHAYGVASLPGGDPVVVGDENRTDLGESQNWRITRYDAATGNIVWTRTYNSPTNGSDAARGVAIRSDGTILVGGDEDRSDLGQDDNMLVRAYDPDGNFLWSFSGAPAITAGDQSSEIAVGPGDAVAVSGGFDNTGGGQGWDWLVWMFQTVAATPSTAGATAPEFETATAYPNPFRPGKGDPAVKIAGVDPGAAVKVFSGRGRLVRTLTADASGVAAWDGTTDSGDRVGSGVYTAVTGLTQARRIVRIVIQR